MKKSRTSKYYFKYSCMEVYEAVTSEENTQGFSYEPMSDEAYENTRSSEVQDGQLIAHVTDRTPGRSCGYEMRSGKFTLHWSATFTEVQGECQMTMTETYEFQKGAVLQYLLAVLFIHQKQQHREFFRTIENRLKLREFRRNSKMKTF